MSHIAPALGSFAAAKGERVSRISSVDVLAGIAVMMVFALTHPFEGIEHDARLYVGRALADLNPGGVGRDLMFRLDGQSSFTVYGWMLAKTIATLGRGPAVLVASLVNMIVWFAAIATFARMVLPGRAIILGLAAVSVLSTFYSPWQLLAAGEAYAVPRPLAEAAVLVALAAICRDRLVAAVALLLVSAAIHPIMAAPGFGVLFVVLCLRDRRWIPVGVLAAVAVLAAGALGLPIASRLFERIDATWRGILVERNPYLFIALWPWGPMGSMLAVRAATIVIACTWLAPRERTVLLAGLGVGVAGVVGSFLFGDLGGSVLTLQAQPWRALWLPAALAPIAAGVCLWRLPQRGASGQVTLALLVAAWSCADWPATAPVSAAAALAMHVWSSRLSIRLDRLAVVVWIVSAGIVACSAWVSTAAFVGVVRSLPDGAALPTIYVAHLGVLVLPTMMLVVAWWRWRDRLPATVAAVLVVAVLGGLLATRWDSRDAARADSFASGVQPADLVQMLAARPGGILWLEREEAWHWLGRPSWNSQIQGSSIVFSRQLALEWRRRAQAVVDAGLASSFLTRPLETQQPYDAPELDATRIGTFCATFPGRSEDEPAWIVVPIDRDTVVPASLGARIWTAPAASVQLVVNDGALHWRRLARYALIPCAPALPR